MVLVLLWLLLIRFIQKHALNKTENDLNSIVSDSFSAQ
jgi:hypothetical protein